MANWKSFLKNNTLEWLLEENNPSIRYFTLIDLLDKKKNSAEVNETKAKIMSEDIVPKILKKQNPDGYWDDPLSYYNPKGKATLWQFYTLVDRAADANDERIRKTCEFLLNNAQHRESGAFSGISYEYIRHISNNKNPRPSERILIRNTGVFSDSLKGGTHTVIPCLTGQMLFNLIRCGYLKDARVQKGINWIVKYQRFDDGEGEAPASWPYNVGMKKGDACWGKHTCRDGVILSLRALSEIPEAYRSKEIKQKIEQCVEFILIHHIHKKSHNLNQISNADWMYLGYPHLDYLFILSILAKLGCKDDRMQDAVKLLISKQNKNGKWIAEKAGYEKKGVESKWVTLRALTALKNFYE